MIIGEYVVPMELILVPAAVLIAYGEVAEFDRFMIRTLEAKFWESKKALGKMIYLKAVRRTDSSLLIIIGNILVTFSVLFYVADAPWLTAVSAPAGAQCTFFGLYTRHRAAMAADKEATELAEAIREKKRVRSRKRKPAPDTQD